MARGVDEGAAVRRVCNHLGLAPARGFPRRAQNNAAGGVARAVEALLGQRN